MKNPNTYYSENVTTYITEITMLKRRMFLLSSLRLIVFFISGLGVYFTYQNWQIAISIGIIGVVIFVLILSKFTDKKAQLSLKKSLHKLNEEELRISEGTFHHRDSGQEYLNPKHFYSYDVDLFGKGSFFQFINRTALKAGRHELANLLTANNTTNILHRQQVIKELSERPDWMQLYVATGHLISTETPTKSIVNWLQSYQSFLPKNMKWLPWFFSITSLILLILTISKTLSFGVLGYWLLVGLGITGMYLKKINGLASNCDKVKATFKQYALLLHQIEDTSFRSEVLQNKQQQIRSEHKRASVIFSEFSKHIDALDNRNNLIGAIFGNGYLLSDLKNAYKVEQWISKYSSTVEDWFKVVAFFDAYCSFGIYTFNHSSFSFPEISEEAFIIKAKNLGHPMLSEDKRVTSDININSKEFFIVTGANMAGKSTFLRTISLHIIMANVGLPVCASKSQYNPIKLITSMRTSDSLTDDSSYFFSELTRLKFIIDAITQESYFIILDEILKGTNSTDKAIGSKKFVEKLVICNATGIIATHDLSLCDIAEELEEVDNYYFDAQIVNDELFFDYKLKEGICQNMNASFLLKKMDIV